MLGLRALGGLAGVGFKFFAHSIGFFVLFLAYRSIHSGEKGGFGI